MRFVFLFLMIFSIMPGFAGVKEKSGTSHGKRGDAKTPLVEYVGVVCPDTAKMFLLEDFPAVLSRSQSQVFTSLSSLSLLYQNQCAILSLRFCREGRECRKNVGSSCMAYSRRSNGTGRICQSGIGIIGRLYALSL